MALVASSLHHRQNASKQSVKKSKYHVIMLISAQVNLLQRGSKYFRGGPKTSKYLDRGSIFKRVHFFRDRPNPAT